MKPHFIITIINTDEMTYDAHTNEASQPVSMIYYQFEPQEDGSVGYSIGVLDNTVSGVIARADGQDEIDYSELDISHVDWAIPLSQIIMSNFDNENIIFSIMGLEPDASHTQSMGIYNLSAEVAEEISRDFYDVIQQACESGRTEANYKRVLDWMDSVRENGARNTEGTMTAVVVRDEKIVSGDNGE